MKWFFSLLLGVSAVVSVLASPAPAQTFSRVNFYCDASQSVPATMAANAGREVTVIRWKSNFGKKANYNPQRRCKEVSNRFQKLYVQDRMQYLTKDKMNGQPVICATRSTNGNGCDKNGLLFTLKPDEDPDDTFDHLQELMQVESKIEVPPLEEGSRPQIYINMDKVLASLFSRNTPKSLKVKPQTSGSLW